MSMDETYTLAQIKREFWETFHTRGEIFFPYIGMGADQKQCETETGYYWKELVDNLRDPNRRKP